MRTFIKKSKIGEYIFINFKTMQKKERKKERDEKF